MYFIKGICESCRLVSIALVHCIDKSLSHDSLYLRLFCYLAKQDKSLSSNSDKWDDTILAKLYMKWKSNGIENTPNEKMMFTFLKWKWIICDKLLGND
ncbi:hypothetical protein RFI_22908 [Reticulomyxa filosa]|uniref:Uncharacterized protein n=1 Tax=Reticulomyxa filosa TaxID=46433 RepID=X6MN06_RETFI|nr:hypothetical protein RFI_22908 [Reticulomyxa filosa]|eukprot:ETO14460.1 hypothetical protein RFI_22908 [Reticulomyxa filosa]